MGDLSCSTGIATVVAYSDDKSTRCDRGSKVLGDSLGRGNQGREGGRERKGGSIEI
jgi:hypothetical protein